MRHRKGLGPYLSRQATDGRLLEGDIGSGGSDEGIAGGDDDGNYDSPSDDPGRDSSRFNGGGGGGGSDPTRRQQRRAIREGVPVSDIVDRETGGRSSFDPGEVTVDDPEFQQRRAVREFDTGGVQTDVDVSTPQAGRGTELGNAEGSVAIDEVPVVSDAVGAVERVGDFVRSGPDEASVGDPAFNDPGTVETEVPTQTGGNETVDPSRPLTGVDQRLVNETTDSGGIVAERPGDSSALLPGEVAGVDISEQRLEEFAAAGEEFGDEIANTSGRGRVGPSPTAATPLSSSFGGEIADAAGRGVTDLAALPGMTESAIEFGQNAPLNETSVQTAGSVAVGAARGTAEQAIEEPVEFGASLGVGVVTGAAGGRALGQAGRAARRGSTRVGGTEIDPTDLTNERTIQFAEGEITDRDAQFPGAADEGLYQTDPAASVRRQADEFTPDEIERRFDAAGVGDGTDLKKAVDRNPEGPAVGRGNTGLETRPGDFESPGAFAGPELSPNFLRLGDRGSADFSLRPGLPDFGSNPTGVVVRTDVENPDADTLNEFNEELLDAEGETTARTLPADEVNPGEAEAVIPPRAEFVPVRGGIGSRVRGRLGVGSDFFTEIDGQPVRLQPVADPDLVGGGSRRGLFGDGADRGQAGVPSRRGAGVGDTRRLSDIRRGGDVGTDRPLPPTPFSSPTASPRSFNDEFGSDLGSAPSGGQSVPDGSTTSPSGGSSPRRSPPAVDRSVFGSFGGFDSRPRGETSVPGGSVPGGFGSFGVSQPGSPGSSSVPSGGSSRGPSSGSSSGSSAATPGGGAGTPAPPAPVDPPARPEEPPEADDEPDRDRLPVRDLPPETPLFGNPVASGIGNLF